MIGFFISIVYQTTHQTLQRKFRISPKRDCGFKRAKCEYKDALKKNEFKADFKYSKNQWQN